MDNFSELKQVWLSADVNTLPTPAQAIKAIRLFRVKKIMRGIGLLLLSLLLAAVMVYVVIFYRSEMLLTRIGEVCMLIAILFLIISNTHSLKRAWQLKDRNNHDFISYLKELQVKKIGFHKRAQLIGFVFSSVGLALYLFEGVYRQQFLMIVAYFFLAVWILVNWFIIRPAAVRRKTRKLNKTIQRLETVEKQFTIN